MSVKEFTHLLGMAAYCLLAFLFFVSVIFLRLPFFVINPYKKFTKWWENTISLKMGTL